MWPFCAAEGFRSFLKEHGPEKNVKMCAAYELKGFHREGFKKTTTACYDSIKISELETMYYNMLCFKK